MPDCILLSSARVCSSNSEAFSPLILNIFFASPKCLDVSPVYCVPRSHRRLFVYQYSNFNLWITGIVTNVQFIPRLLLFSKCTLWHCLFVDIVYTDFCNYGVFNIIRLVTILFKSTNLFFILTGTEPVSTDYSSHASGTPLGSLLFLRNSVWSTWLSYWFLSLSHGYPTFAFFFSTTHLHYPISMLLYWFNFLHD